MFQSSRPWPDSPGVQAGMTGSWRSSPKAHPVAGGWRPLQLLPPILVLDTGCGARSQLPSSSLNDTTSSASTSRLPRLHMASRLVPSAMIACVDMTELAFPPSCSMPSARSSLYSHVPLQARRSAGPLLSPPSPRTAWLSSALGAKDAEADYGPYFGTSMLCESLRQWRVCPESSGPPASGSSLQALKRIRISKIATHLFVLARRRRLTTR